MPRRRRLAGRPPRSGSEPPGRQTDRRGNHVCLSLSQMGVEGWGWEGARSSEAWPVCVSVCPHSTPGRLPLLPVPASRAASVTRCGGLPSPRPLLQPLPQLAFPALSRSPGRRHQGPAGPTRHASQPDSIGFRRGPSLWASSSHLHLGGRDDVLTLAHHLSGGSSVGPLPLFPGTPWSGRPTVLGGVVPGAPNTVHRRRPLAGPGDPRFWVSCVGGPGR